MGRVRQRDAFAAAAIALIAGLFFSSAAFDGVHGLSIDILTALRWRLFGAHDTPAAAPTAVIVIDEETYRTPPFAGSPTLTWTRELGRVLNAVVEGGAKVVGFDIVFPTSVEQSEIPFDEQPLGTRMRGFDRDYLRALATAARDGKLVLGEVLHLENPVRPSAGQRIAVGQQRNIRALNTYNDPDEVVRRLPLTFTIGGQPVPSMAVELAARALGTPPQVAADGTVTLAGYTVPGTTPNTMTLNYGGGDDNGRTYSFADLHACLDKHDPDFFRRHFAGKVVLVGTLLDIEDRKLTSKRFAAGSERAGAQRCALPAPVTMSPPRSTISGVFIHATGVDNLIRRDALVEVGHPARVSITISVAAAAAFAAMLLSPLAATAAWFLITLAFTAGATAAMMHGVVLPLVAPALAGLAATGMTVGYRFGVAEREERFLRKSFELYLAPQVIDTMLASNKAPALGGEIREVTVFFSDIADFSAIAEAMPPSDLVNWMNVYLSEMTDIIEACSGYVDKYIGDSIVAVFGAPAHDPDHARNAVLAAQMCCDRLAALNATEFQSHPVCHRIGLNTGLALVGNIGSRKRFNYTVMSDAVNVASRLEGANKYFGTVILASETTVRLAGTAFAWREIDAIRVKGRVQPVHVFEPLAAAEDDMPEQKSRAAIYAQGLALYRARAFAEAAVCFARLPGDPAAEALRARAEKFVAHPPGPDWAPVFTLEGK